MAETVKPRNVTPIIRFLRSFLLQRKFDIVRGTLRYSPLVSTRTQPPPIMPPGCSASVSANSYCKRDGRREAEPPQVIAQNTAKVLLADGKEESKAVGAVKPSAKFPGKVYRFD